MVNFIQHMCWCHVLTVCIYVCIPTSFLLYHTCLHIQNSWKNTHRPFFNHACSMHMCTQTYAYPKFLKKMYQPFHTMLICICVPKSMCTQNSWKNSYVLVQTIFLLCSYAYPQHMHTQFFWKNTILCMWIPKILEKICKDHFLIGIKKQWQRRQASNLCALKS